MPKSLKCCLILLILGVNSVGAQQRSPIAELLTRARTALDNLQNGRADSIGRSVLALGTQASREERLQALEIIAAALYPEDAAARNRDAATAMLKDYVRMAPDRDIPRSMSWPGLDSLLLNVRATTFAAVARPPHDTPLAGTSAEVDVPVVATRPARFSLYAVPRAGGAPQLLDTAAASRATHLHFGVLAGDQVRMPSGAYFLELRARDVSGRDSVVERFPSVVSSPPLDLVSVPTAVGPDQLLPESAPAHRGRDVVIGVALGGATALLANLFRAPNPVRSRVGSDTKAYGVAVGLGLVGVLGGLSDHGTALPDNVRHNLAVRAQFASQVQAARDENARRRNAYRATVTIEGDPQ